MLIGPSFKPFYQKDRGKDLGVSGRPALPDYQYTWCAAGLVAISHTAAMRSAPA